MAIDQHTMPHGWLAFEQNVMNRVAFDSVVMPFVPETGLAAYLKRTGKRVAANDQLQSSWVAGLARVQNDRETLSSDDINIVLEEAYVPGYRLENASLTTWFSEVDAWWFDNVRRNIDRLQSPIGRAVAANLAVATGDYALSFSPETRELRQPLSNVFRRLWSIEPEPFGGNARSVCSNQPAEDLLIDVNIIENFGDLMFLRLPAMHPRSIRDSLGRVAWREEWLRGGNAFWDEVERANTGRLGSGTETKSQYLRLFERTLERATHFKKWAISCVESGFITSQDIIDTIARIRRVETVFTKDFTELTGAKAVIITA